MTPPYRSDFWIINVPIAPGRHSCAAGQRSPNYPATARRNRPQHRGCCLSSRRAGHPGVRWSKSRARVRTNRPFWLQILYFNCFHECSSIVWMSYDVLWDFLGYIMIYVSLGPLGDLFGFVRFRVLTSRTLSYRSAGMKVTTLWVLIRKG